MILRYITQFLIVLSPLVSGDWSLLDLFGYRPDAAGNVSVAHMAILTGMKAEVEFKLKVGIAVTLFALTLVSEFTSVAMPLEQMRGSGNGCWTISTKKNGRTCSATAFD